MGKENIQFQKFKRKTFVSDNCVHLDVKTHGDFYKIIRIVIIRHLGHLIQGNIYKKKKKKKVVVPDKAR